MKNTKSTGVILVAGGTGQRMNAPLPKQYLELNGKAIATYSFDLFLNMQVFAEIVVVSQEDMAIAKYWMEMGNVN